MDPEFFVLQNNLECSWWLSLVSLSTHLAVCHKPKGPTKWEYDNSYFPPYKWYAARWSNLFKYWGLNRLTSNFQRHYQIHLSKRLLVISSVTPNIAPNTESDPCSSWWSHLLYIWMLSIFFHNHIILHLFPPDLTWDDKLFQGKGINTGATPEVDYIY